jgi:hypothetical protein
MERTGKRGNDLRGNSDGDNATPGQAQRHRLAGLERDASVAMTRDEKVRELAQSIKVEARICALRRLADETAREYEDLLGRAAVASTQVPPVLAEGFRL